MAEPHPNIVKFTRIVRAFNENDFDTIKALVSEDCRYYVAGGGMLAGEYKGRSAFAEFLRKARAETKDVIAIELKVMTSSDDHVMTYGVVRAERNGKRLESRNMYLYRFGQDGTLAEGMNVPVDQEKWTAFWS
jgi:ketosteroid isomerase-like protein